MPFNLDEENFYPRFIMEFYKTLRLDRYSEDNCLFITFDINGHEFNISLDQFAELTSLPNQGICLYSDASLDQLEPNLEQVPPYNSNLPSLEDIRYRIHQKLVIRENVYVAIGNRDHVQASIAFTLYFIEVGMQYNLECFMISEEHQNERTPSPPPRRKSLSPLNSPSKSTSSRSTYRNTSSSPSESPTPTHVASPPKLRLVIPMKLEP
ncbi:hypothetical protein Tco_1507738 [Tanacetum coccineum]